ncbi:MAG TPA: condensation domain-containing protein, partial [Candidatus Limnocylindrales bacterium]|nr:condensation domain-containing protein [Candidatus Limnocylindrales bacterium]
HRTVTDHTATDPPANGTVTDPAADRTATHRTVTDRTVTDPPVNRTPGARPADLARKLAALTPQQRAELARKLRPTVSRSLPRLDRSSGRLPMSPAQQRHYFLQKLHPESPAYNNIEAVTVRGRLDFGAVREAVATLVRRHEVLRLRCDGPEFVLDDNPTIEVSQVDSIVGIAERFAELAERPFDLDRELPLRVAVAPGAILFVVHHIASDAWSCRLLVREFFQAYAGKALPPLTIQYADLAALPTTTGIDYWRNRLDGMPPLIELPLDRPRPAVRDDHGAEIHLPLDRDRLHRTAKEAGVTPFALLLTAFAYVLHRHCATRDVVVGTPVSGRSRVEAEQVIGCFINTVVLRLDIGPAPTRRALAQRLWATTLDDLSHADVPFERLVAEVNPGRDLTAGQLVQVLFNHYQATEVTEPVAGLEIRSLTVPRRRAKFDLTCTVVEASDGMTVTFNYATALLDGSFVDRLGEHFVAVLDALLDDLDAPMATLPAVPARRPALSKPPTGHRPDRPAALREVRPAYPGPHRRPVSG